MAGTIYLYGVGETQKTNGETEDFKGCYLKCSIPDNLIKSGFFPSVLHSYIMYAKDIGLMVTNVFYDFAAVSGLQNQFVYSLWPLFYVNNSDVFTEGDKQGVGIWAIQDQQPDSLGLEFQYSIELDTDYGIFYRNATDQGKRETIPNYAVLADNPLPSPGKMVVSDTVWYLDLTEPEAGGGDASSYAVIQHYTDLVVWGTLLDMQKRIEAPVGYTGTKQATGQVLQAVMDRKYAYDAIVPKWSTSWGAEPDWYDNMRTSMNNYNIGASLFVFPDGEDPEIATLTLLGTALNIKGQLKAGHAETRLLLTIDTIDYANRGAYYETWFADVCAFYGFDDRAISIRNIYRAYAIKDIALISSLKPCYLCAGEVDATTDGFIETINAKTVEMWACFPYLEYQPKIRKVLYFDIDRPITYAAHIETVIHVGDRYSFEWDLSLVPWYQWSAFLNTIPSSEYKCSFIKPIGPRIVEPAGECLKSGSAFTRYKNSVYLLLTDDETYAEELKDWITGSLDSEIEEM